METSETPGVCFGKQEFSAEEQETNMHNIFLITRSYVLRSLMVQVKNRPRKQLTLNLI